MNTYTFGTATLTIDADEQSACLRIPSTFEGEYERDYAAVTAFLARSGMPSDALCEVVSGYGEETYVWAWEGSSGARWDPETIAHWEREAAAPLVPSELRHEIKFRKLVLGVDYTI